MTLTDQKNLRELIKEKNPTQDEILERMREMSLNPTPDPVQKVKFSNAWGLDDNYQGLGNGNYTMEEYESYELKV